jgi:MFS family permease
MLVDAGSFVVCALLLLELRAVGSDADRSARERLIAAWRHVRSLPQLRSLLVAEAAALVFFASITPVEVIYAKATLHAGDVGYGVLMSVWGVGMVLGGTLFARTLRVSLGSLLWSATLLVGVAYVGFATAPSLGAACAAALLGGVGNGVQWASLLSAVQELAPEGLYGRLMSAVEALGALAPSLGFALGGMLAALASPRAAFGVAGGAAIVLAGVFVRLAGQRSALRTLHPPQAARAGP